MPDAPGSGYYDPPSERGDGCPEYRNCVPCEGCELCGNERCCLTHCEACWSAQGLRLDSHPDMESNTGNERRRMA